MSELLPLLSVAVGGAVGGAVRHLVAMTIARRLGERFPWGILAVNLSGAAAMGALAAAVPTGDATLRLLLGTGFLGGYTTVSTFSLQTLTLFEAGRPVRALVYAGGSVAGAIAAAAAGFAAAGFGG